MAGFETTDIHSWRTLAAVTYVNTGNIFQHFIQALGAQGLDFIFGNAPTCSGNFSGVGTLTVHHYDVHCIVDQWIAFDRGRIGLHGTAQRQCEGREFYRDMGHKALLSFLIGIIQAILAPPKKATSSVTVKTNTDRQINTKGVDNRVCRGQIVPSRQFAEQKCPLVSH